MKKMKKVIAFALAMVLALAMNITVFATNVSDNGADTKTYTIKIDNDATGHTYEAYQIFAGDLATDESGNLVLSNVTWGTGVNEDGQTALGDAAAKAETLKVEADAKAFATTVSAYLATVAGSATEPDEDGNYVISGLAAGYYLVKDADGSLAGDNDSYTSFILKVVADQSVTPKSDVPSAEKKVKDTNDTTGVTSDWQDSADYDIGDAVPFQLKGTVASNYDAYTAYKFIFHDKESAGLTFNPESVKVYVDGNEITSGYSVETEEIPDGETFNVVFSNLKDIDSVHAGSVITVEYTSTLNENAVLGAAGNPNDFGLEYSNNPNNSQGGDNDETGETPWDRVIVFTYKVVVNKVDQNEKPLTGAEFTLSKKLADGTTKAIAVVKNDEGTTFTFNGLDDGEYVLSETVTPAGYNTIDDITFTVTAEHDILSDSPALTELNGNKVTGEISFTADKTAGSLTSSIINQQGSTLPATGGMGTTILYVVGVILVVGAGIFLVSKKRANKQ